MTWTRPCRRITLQCSQILLTLGRTFISASLLVAIGDAASSEVVGGELHLDPIPGKDPDVVHPHLPGDVSEYVVTVFELHPEHGVWQRFDDGPLQYDRVFFGFRQGSGLLTGDRGSGFRCAENHDAGRPADNRTALPGKRQARSGPDG